MRWASTLLATLLVWTHISVASANFEAPVEPVRLVTGGAAACATAAELIARVRARTPRVDFVTEGDASLARVRFLLTPSQEIAVEVEMVRHGATTFVRRLTAAGCEDAADGAALILAITLDPLPPGPTAEGANVGSASSEPSGDANADPSSHPNDALPDRVEVTASKPPVLNQPTSASPQPADATLWRGGAYVAGGGLAGPGPDPMATIALSALVGVDERAFWSPAVMVGGLYTWTVETKEWGGTAAFTLAAFTLDACAVRLDALKVQARVCASALGGRLSATGSDTINSTGTIHRPFAAVGTSVLVVWDPTPPLSVLLQLASRANLVRDEFEFYPRAFHAVGNLSHSASLGIGMTWPWAD